MTSFYYFTCLPRREHISTTALSFRLCLLYLLQVFLYSAQCTAIYREHSSLNSFAVRDEQASPVPALLRSLYHEPALTRFIACYAGCSFSNGTRKTNAAFGVACFSLVLIILQHFTSFVHCFPTRGTFYNKKRHSRNCHAVFRKNLHSAGALRRRNRETNVQFGSAIIATL